MKIFISWSEFRSKAMAEALKNWIPDVIQACKPWISSEDIDPGARWSLDLAKQLEEAQFGIICLTPENLNSPWIHFEAGSISKKLEDKTRVCPYLLDLEPTDIEGPLVQFQAIRANKEETKRLMQSINQALGEESLLDERFSKGFDTFWPQLEENLKKISEISSCEKKLTRSVNDMLEEILKIVREQARTTPTEIELAKMNASEKLKRRDKLEIIRDILCICDGRDATKKDIVKNASLSYSTTQEYLDWLICNDLVSQEENAFHATPKGSELSSNIRDVKTLFEL